MLFILHRFELFIQSSCVYVNGIEVTDYPWISVFACLLDLSC